MDTRLSHAMDKQQQSDMTPDAALRDLMAGNARFVNRKMLQRDYAKQAECSADGQYPKAVILACIDSRVPVELIFDQGIGDVFAVRVAGHVVDSCALGSLEYACRVARSPLLLVLGHTDCGAVKSAIDRVVLGHITDLLRDIEPAIARTKGYARNAKNADYVAAVVENHVRQTIDHIRDKSPILAEIEQNAEIAIRGGVYHLRSGRVVLI